MSLIVPENIEKNREEQMPWPQNYYRETEPEKRLEILKGYEAEHPDEDFSKLHELFDIRFKPMNISKKTSYADTFMAQLLELIALSNSKRGASKYGKKTMKKIYSDLCLDREEEFGSETLSAELSNAVGRYIDSSLSDKAFRSVILGFGRIDDEKAYAKVRGILERISVALPEDADMTKEFATFRKAVVEMEQLMLGD